MAKLKSENWSQKKINWLNLRGFGQSKVASVTLAAPFVGYMILYHDKLQPYLGGLGGLLSENHCTPIIDFMIKLHLLYLGLLCLGIGTLIYRVCADKVIQSYASISDYVEREEPHVTARNLRSMLITIKSRRAGMEPQFLERANWLDRKKMDLTEASHVFKDADPNIGKDVLRSYYNVLSRHSSRHWVYVVAGFYVVGFLLLAIPGFAFTLRVLCVLISAY